jgi:pyruvate dehydrogenase E1 component alpha subunit
MATSERDAARVDGRPEFLGLSDDELKELLRDMEVARRFEEKTAESYQLGKIGGFCHLYIGQEAVAVGAISALRDDDYVIASYRSHVHALVRGLSPGRVMAELYGRADGVSGGHGGSMHLFHKELNFLGGHGIVGSHLPIAAGVGYAIRYRDGDQVCLCTFGEAAVNIGAFHESFNMAARWKLPVVYLCENNMYGMGTAIDRVTAAERIVQRACTYEGMHSEQVEGMDVIAVRAAMERAVHIARDKKEPTFLEVNTYRYVGHSIADPSHGVYRTREEVEEERENDPIISFRGRLIDAGVLSAEEFDEIDRAAIDEAEAAAAFADKSPLPDESELYDTVYSDEYPHGVDRRDAWR